MVAHVGFQVSERSHGGAGERIEPGEQQLFGQPSMTSMRHSDWDPPMTSMRRPDFLHNHLRCPCVNPVSGPPPVTSMRHLGFLDNLLWRPCVKAGFLDSPL
mgnify:CR=1 FL=1